MNAESACAFAGEPTASGRQPCSRIALFAILPDTTKFRVQVRCAQVRAPAAASTRRYILLPARHERTVGRHAAVHAAAAFRRAAIERRRRR